MKNENRIVQGKESEQSLQTCVLLDENIRKEGSTGLKRR